VFARTSKFDPSLRAWTTTLYSSSHSILDYCHRDQGDGSGQALVRMSCSLVGLQEKLVAITGVVGYQNDPKGCKPSAGMALCPILRWFGQESHGRVRVLTARNIAASGSALSRNLVAIRNWKGSYEAVFPARTGPSFFPCGKALYWQFCEKERSGRRPNHWSERSGTN